MNQNISRYINEATKIRFTAQTADNVFVPALSANSWRIRLRNPDYVQDFGDIPNANVFVTELGDGEYALNLPGTDVVGRLDMIGEWQITIWNTDPSIWRNFINVNVMEREYVVQGSVSENGITLTVGAWLELNGARALDFESCSGAIITPDGEVLQSLGTSTAPTDDGVFYLSAPSKLQPNVSYVIRLTFAKGNYRRIGNLGVIKA